MFPEKKCWCCEICKSNLYSEIANDYIKRREFASRRWLSSPNSDFLECVSHMQDIINFILSNNTALHDFGTLLTVSWN